MIADTWKTVPRPDPRIPRRLRRGLAANGSLAGWAFAAPALIIYIAFLAYPAVTSFSISLTSWNGISPTKTFVGLQNYVHLIHDSVVQTAARNDLIWALVTIVV